MSTAPSTAVCFPPRLVADFIIHYDTDFHVHKLVLYHHSAYFRAYFQALLDSSSPSNGTQPCSSHPQIAHCIHLPRQTRLVEKTPVTADDFRLFLCHLYFSSHYCYPPYLPSADLDLSSDTPSLTVDFSSPALEIVSVPLLDLNFPPVPSIDWSDDSTQG